MLLNGVSVVARPDRDAHIEKGNRIAGWLREQGQHVDFIPFALRGESEVELHLHALLLCAHRVSVLTGQSCQVELIPALTGREGEWVTLVFGEYRRKYLIGRSGDWLDCHVAKTSDNDPGVPLQRLEFTIAK